MRYVPFGSGAAKPLEVEDGKKILVCFLCSVTFAFIKHQSIKNPASYPSLLLITNDQPEKKKI